MSVNIVLDTLKAAFFPYIKSIHSFHFYYNNPLVWVGFMILYLILEIGISWSPSKAFFFCVSVASILLGITWLERSLIKVFTIPGYEAYSLDAFVLKIISLVLISIVIVYFVFVDNS
jgi:hypothetical protein